MRQLLLAKANRKAFDQLTFAAVEGERTHSIARGFQKLLARDREERRVKKLADTPARRAIAATACRVQLGMGHPFALRALSGKQAKNFRGAKCANLLRNEKSPLKFQTRLVFGCEGIAVPFSELFERSGLRAGLFFFGACFPPCDSCDYSL
ncbi:hypothetical protein [Methylocystis echinoides]|uniref:hypothetical protein n=1 Tax=Methylocystis echinoides TaxID=29468 RepID=UPI0034342918